MSETPSDKRSIHQFGTEVNQLLKLMINALYSNREIFLRELISNASDASDKLRFEALTHEELKGLDQDLSIQVSFDPEKHLLVVEDHGIGMTKDEVIENLGTIARSGTRQFLEQLSGDKKQDANLIGQFGVGFYSAFIVADQVVVETRRAGLEEDEAIRWTSSGEAEYSLEAISKETHGTRVVLHVAEDHQDLLSKWQLQRIIKHYSNHIAFPIELISPDSPEDSDKEAKEQSNVEVINEAKALWTRSKSEITDEEYEAFYTALSHDVSPPLSWAHHQVEGAQSYSLLLYLPKQAPFDLMVNRETVEGLKLYIQRVFIMDAAEQLLPRYLRFMRGVVDSADLPLNVSREILQDSPLLNKIRATVTKRSLALIDKVTQRGGDEWEQFWKAFGGILKEGVIEDHENREDIAQLLRFSSSASDEMTGLDQYIERMPDGQEDIWYLTAENLHVAKNSPHLESFKKKGIEVLLLTDRIDEWVVSHLHDFKGHKLKSVTIGLSDDDEAKPDKAAQKLAGRIKTALGERVGNVKPTDRLTDSAARVVTDEHQMSLQMQRLMKQAGQEVPEIVPNLEINAGHPLIQLLNDQSGEFVDELSHLIFDQALLAEGGEIVDPSGYVKRVNNLLVSALAQGKVSK